jgi:hypothetical protein
MKNIFEMQIIYTLQKSNFFEICTFLDQDCLEKCILTADHLNIAKKLIFFFYLYIFTALYLLVGNRT